METYSRRLITRWKPSELTEVHAFCSSRRLEVSSLARMTLLYVVRNPRVFEGFARISLDAETSAKLQTAELALNWDAPPVPQKSTPKRPKQRRGGKEPPKYGRRV